jgi:hypothetical protein
MQAATMEPYGSDHFGIGRRIVPVSLAVSRQYVLTVKNAEIGGGANR